MISPVNQCSHQQITQSVPHFTYEPRAGTPTLQQPHPKGNHPTMNLKNLAELATYLESLPKDYTHFDMGTYFSHPKDDYGEISRYAEENGGLHECGTVACALGHGPAAGILFPKRPSKLHEESPFWGLFCSENGAFFEPSWENYSRRFFICPILYGPEWEWCFGGFWKNQDEAPAGAAARIRYILDGKKPPEVTTYSGNTIPFTSIRAAKEHLSLYSEYLKAEPVS